MITGDRTQHNRPVTTLIQSNISWFYSFRSTLAENQPIALERMYTYTVSIYNTISSYNHYLTDPEALCDRGLSKLVGRPHVLKKLPVFKFFCILSRIFHQCRDESSQILLFLHGGHVTVKCMMPEL